MILDSFKSLSRYKNICKGITETIAFAKKHDLEALPPGRYELSGGAYVNVLAYETKPEPASPVFEAHRKYIDLQYVISGKETMLWQSLENGRETKGYDETGDYALFKAAEPVRLALSGGMFCIFFPKDLHCPSLSGGAPENVKKAVFKIPL